MSSRTDSLRVTLVGQFDDAVIFPVDPPTNAGVWFVKLDGWKVLAHLEQLDRMADALDDREFVLFTDALIDLCRNVLGLLNGDDTDVAVEQAVFDAQQLTSVALPDAYRVLDAVFAVDL